MPTSLVAPLLGFLQDNYFKIVVALVIIFFAAFIFYVTATSLRKLKTEIFSSYPFDLFFPSSGKWSVGYFLILILLLGLLIFFVAKGGFYLGPA